VLRVQCEPLFPLDARKTQAIGSLVERRDRKCHIRLINCGVAAIRGLALERLLLAALLMYPMVAAVFIGMIAFARAGTVRDKRRYGGVHPARWLSFGSLVVLQVTTGTLGGSACAATIYDRTGFRIAR
jgi:hypothetical protein